MLVHEHHSSCKSQKSTRTTRFSTIYILSLSFLRRETFYYLFGEIIFLILRTYSSYWDATVNVWGSIQRVKHHTVSAIHNKNPRINLTNIKYYKLIICNFIEIFLEKQTIFSQKIARIKHALSTVRLIHKNSQFIFFRDKNALWG